MQHNSRIVGLSRDWLRIVGITMCACQAMVALVVLGRWVAGALTRGLGPLQACLVATLAAGLSVAAYLALRRSGTPAEPRAALIAAFAPALSLGLLLISSGSLAAVGYATVLVAVCAGVAFVVESGPNSRHDSQASIARRSAGDLAHGGDGPPVVQWMSRRQETAGVETVEGSMQVAFAAGERQQVLHLSFCPPLPGVPTVECEVLDEAPVDVRVGAAHPYGARIEARREGEATRLLATDIGFTAKASAVDRAAA